MSYQSSYEMESLIENSLEIIPDAALPTLEQYLFKQNTK